MAEIFIKNEKKTTKKKEKKSAIKRVKMQILTNGLHCFSSLFKCLLKFQISATSFQKFTNSPLLWGKYTNLAGH